MNTPSTVVSKEAHPSFLGKLWLLCTWLISPILAYKWLNRKDISRNEAARFTLLLESGCAVIIFLFAAQYDLHYTHYQRGLDLLGSVVLVILYVAVWGSTWLCVTEVQNRIRAENEKAQKVSTAGVRRINC